MALAARRWDFTASASTSASAATATKVEPPFGYAQRGTGGQVVESAAAGKASIEELNKEKAMKQRVRRVCRENGGGAVVSFRQPRARDGRRLCVLGSQSH